MFKQVSFPFAEMVQGVVSNGLGYVAEKSVKSLAWLWWLLLPLLLIVGGIIYFVQLDKKKEEEQKKLAEEQEKQNLIDQQTKITPV